jgi:hypothetical protein
MKQKIFSGVSSNPMWDAINNAKTIADLREALYIVCCRLQELEDKVKEATK